MASNIMSDWNFNDNYKELMGLIPSAFQGRKQKGEEEVAVLVATLFYLRKKNALKVLRTTAVLGNKDYLIISWDDTLFNSLMGQCICCDTKVFDNIDNIDFRMLLMSSFNTFREANEPKYILEFVDALNRQEFEDGELPILLDKYVYGSYSLNRELNVQPHEISQIVSCLVNKETKKIFDPFGGLMYFATAMPDKQFVGYENNEMTRNLALFRMALAGIDDRTILHPNNVEYWTNEIFDAIVTYPPFGYRLDMRDRILGVKTDAEQVVLSRFEDTTNMHGQLVMVAPLSLLYRNDQVVKDYRERFVKNNWLDTIIVLPSNLMKTTSVATAIIVLKKDRSQNDRIRFIDASTCTQKKNGRNNIVDVEQVLGLLEQADEVHSIDVTTEDILKQDSSWNVQWYIGRHNEVFSDGYTIVECSEIIEPIEFNRHFTEQTGRIVNVSSLSPDFYNYEKTVDEFALSDDLKGTSKVTEPALLISLIGTPKPTFCNASEQTPLFIKSDVCAYRIINDTVHVGYLCMELAKRLKQSPTSVIIPRLSKTEIMRSKIEFPSLNEQRSLIEQTNIFAKAKTENQESQIKLLGLQEYVDKIKTEFKDSIRGRKHAVGQYLSDVSAYWNVLNSYRKEKNGCLMDADMVDEDYQTTVNDLFCSIDTKLNSALKQLETLLSDENEWEGLDLDVIEPDDFIDEYIRANNDVRFNYVHEGIDLEYYKKLEETEFEDWTKILFPSKVLTRVFEDIIKNAVEYGFTDTSRKDYKVFISQEFIDMDCWEIRIANNGEPVPDSLDPTKVFNLGYTTGMGKGHTGRGAYEVKQLMEMYGGEVKFLSTPDEEYTVTYVLIFKNIK